MQVWDTGTYETLERKDGKRVVVLSGDRAEGRYALFATGKRGGRDWMIHRMDPPLDPDRREPPTDWRPTGVVEGPLPAGDDHAFELWWPGLRVLVVNMPGDTVLLDGDGTNISKGFTELRRLARALGSTEVVLDGVVVEVRDGLPVPEPVGLAKRAAGVSDSVRRRLARDHPVRLLAVDLLWRDGYPRIDRPWHERRAELEELALHHDAWQVPGVHEGDGTELLAAVGERGGKGLVAKRRDVPYRPGVTTGDWVAVRA
jgi:bifunctional non-homologous end joining protein LigD